MTRGPVTAETIELLARLQGIEVLPGHADPLAGALQAHLQSFDPLERLDLEGRDPAVHFDPRWHD